MGSGVGGQIRGINLDAFLQMAQMEKTTCTLTIKTSDEVGYIYMVAGVLFAAQTGDLANKDSLYRILSWENVSIEIENTCIKTENEINLPLMTLLMDGLRLKDDNKVPVPTTFTRPSEEPYEPPSIKELEIEKEPLSDFKDLSKPSEKVERPPVDRESKHAEKAEQPQEPLKPSKRGRPSLAVIGLVGVLVLAIGGFIAFTLLKSGGIEEEFQLLLSQLENQPEKERQIGLLQNFVNSHEPGEYTAKAQEKIKEIRLLLADTDFNRLTATVSNLSMDDTYQQEATALYNQFLAKHPDSRHAVEIRQRISEIPDLIDEADYKKVTGVEEGSFDEKISVYSWYLDKHPDGKYRNSVEKRITDMGESYYDYLKKAIHVCNEKKEWDTCIKLCSYFITLFKDNPRLEEVVALKIKLQSQQELTNLMREVEDKGTDYQAIEQIYMTFLEKNPDSIHRDRIKSELDRIDQQIKIKTEWKNILSYSKNKQTDVFIRVEQLDRYISQNPSSPYLKDAKQLMSDLKEEGRTVHIQLQKEAAQRSELARIQAEKDGIARINAQKRQQEQDMTARLRKSGDRFKPNGDGTVTDSNTGLTWVVLDSYADLGRCLDYRSAKDYVSQLKTGGYSDWRLPTANELAGIYKNEPFFPSSEVPWYWSSQAYWKGYHEIAVIVTTAKETTYRPEQKRQTECGVVRAVRH